MEPRVVGSSPTHVYYPGKAVCDEPYAATAFERRADMQRVNWLCADHNSGLERVYKMF